MEKILLGQKLGMTQIWDDKGRLIAGTVIFAKPNSVVSSKNTKHVAVEVAGKTNKPQQPIAKVIGSERGIFMKEVPTLTTDKDLLDVTQFEVGDKVKVSGVTKGQGFSGTIKRHNFHRGPISHGGDNVRAPGSIGAQRPQRVPKGQKMAGRMGGENLTIRGGKILAVNLAENILVVSGNIPGPARGKVMVQSQ